MSAAMSLDCQLRVVGAFNADRRAEGGPLRSTRFAEIGTESGTNLIEEKKGF